MLEFAVLDRMLVQQQSVETGKNETVTTISIVDFEFNLPLDSKLFVFDEQKYQDYYMNILD